MNELIRRQPLLPGAVLFAAVLWTFWPAVHNDFVGYDDPVYVTGNGHVQQGLSWKNVCWAFSTGEGGNWHPLTWLSHMSDCELFGVSPWGHHLVSIVFHALNVALVFVMLRNATGATWRSFAVAAFFGLHPLRVESVAWIAERKDVLSGFFFLLTLIAYTKYVSSAGGNEVQSLTSFVKSTTEVRRSEVQSSRLWYGMSLILFAFGLLCKPMVVTLPFILLLLDYWPLRRWKVQSPKSEFVRKLLKWFGLLVAPSHTPLEEGVNEKPPGFVKSAAVQLWVEKIPFFVLALSFSIVTMVVQRRGGAMSLAIPFAGRVENAVVSYCRYIGKIFFPDHLAFFYPYQSGWTLGAIVSAIVLLAVLSTVGILWRRQYPYLLTGWLWFIGALIPVIGLVQVGEQALADRYTYLPSMGLLIALVWGAHELTRGWRFQGGICGSFAAVMAVVCAVKTRDQIGIWKDNQTLFAHAIAVTSNNYIAHNNLGATLEREGRLEEAMAQFRQAIAEKPDYAQAHRNLGVQLEHRGESTKAMAEFREAIRLDPSYADPHNDLGGLYKAQGRLNEAVEEFEQALKRKPDFADAHFNLGLAYVRKGLFDAAIREQLAVLEVQPNRADAHNNLGVAFDNLGRSDEAIGEYLEAIRLEPGYARARFNLGVALSHKGAVTQAIEQFQKALKSNPDYREAWTNLNALLEMQKTAGK